MTQDTTPARAVADGDPALAAIDISAQPQQPFETPGPAEVEETPGWADAGPAGDNMTCPFEPVHGGARVILRQDEFGPANRQAPTGRALPLDLLRDHLGVPADATT